MQSLLMLTSHSTFHAFNYNACVSAVWKLWQEGREDRKTCNRNHGARCLVERFSLHFEEHILHRKWPFLERKPLRAQGFSSVESVKPPRKEIFSAIKLLSRIFSSELPARIPRLPVFASLGTIFIIISMDSLHIFALLYHIKDTT